MFALSGGHCWWKEARTPMRSWLGRMPCVFIWFAFIGTSLFGTALGVPPSADQMRCWIGQLGSRDFVVNAEATRNLAAAGDAAVESLLASAGKSDAEAAWRATTVLEQIALQGNESTLRKITAGLEELTRRGKPGFEGFVEELQARQSRLQRERAVSTIRSLGGRFESDEKAPALSVAIFASSTHGDPSSLEPPPESPVGQPVLAVESSTPTGGSFIGDAYVSPEFVNGREDKEPVFQLMIDEHWRGGDAGLAALLELGSVMKVRFQRAPLTDAALDQLATVAHLQSAEFECCHFSVKAIERLRQRQPLTQIVVHEK